MAGGPVKLRIATTRAACLGRAASGAREQLALAVRVRKVEAQALLGRGRRHLQHPGGRVDALPQRWHPGHRLRRSPPRQAGLQVRLARRLGPPMPELM